ncbi:hypothetical protein, conserved [Eimeria tenella]|uniref:Uncharacterized protein n=1 Tax=Eimeria tenella TaxID=5802 RepID=U6KV47_EIMTE|nr:hypothetical protein, conserved [Eimeria tenella]CDJ40803.1 hypothetical protein, conserved [Eimeria tenella]|eukprot:XP_013231553.1 hypothetical protein, conserved [Eimeria tenella]
MFRSQEKHQGYQGTSWGLYNISFDGGRALLSWAQRLSSSSEAVANAVRLGQQQTAAAQYQAWAAQCPAACQDALTTRLACYRRLASVSTLLLGASALGGALALLAVGWFFLFGKMAYLIVSCCFLGGLLCCSVGGYWLWETGTCWNMIVLSQQFPLPRLSTAFYLMAAGAGLYFAAAAAGFAAELLDRARERQAKELLKRQALLEAAGGPDAFAPGILGPPGMPPGLLQGGPLLGGPPLVGAPGMPQMGPPPIGGPMARPPMLGGPIAPMGGPIGGPIPGGPLPGGPIPGAPMPPGPMMPAIGRGLPMAARPTVLGGAPIMGVQGKAPPMHSPSLRPPM